MRKALAGSKPVAPLQTSPTSKSKALGDSFQNCSRFFAIKDYNMPRNSKLMQKQLVLRSKLWPNIHPQEHLWLRKERDGFTTLPRTMPLIMQIMDNMSPKGKPVSGTYLELWSRAFDECFVTLSKPREMAFHSGFTGQRGERTWKGRLQILSDLGFIMLQPGPSGPMSYALILNPYKVIQYAYHNKPNAGITADKFLALQARAIEIGANDLDHPWLTEEQAAEQKRKDAEAVAKAQAEADRIASVEVKAARKSSTKEKTSFLKKKSKKIPKAEKRS